MTSETAEAPVPITEVLAPTDFPSVASGASVASSASVATNNLVSWDDFDKTDESFIPVPVCGGIHKLPDGTLTAFVGTDPDSKVNVWSYDQDQKKYIGDRNKLVPSYKNKKGPIWNGQYRPSSLKEITKVEESCTRHSGTKFDGLSGKDGGAPPLALTTYKDIIRSHMIKHGMWDIFQYREPKSGVKVDLLTTLGRFDLAEIKTYISKQRAIADEYELQNFAWSGKYLLSSISPSLYKDVLKKVTINASGPEVLMAIVSCVATFTYDSMEKVKSRLKSITIKSYPGENIKNMNVDIKALCEQLYSAGFWEKELLQVISKKYKLSTCEEFCLWAIGTLSEKTIDYLRSVSLMDDSAMMPDKIVTYDMLLDLSTKKYEDLLGSAEWTPHVSTKNDPVEPDVPKAYQASIKKAVSKSIKKHLKKGNKKPKDSDTRQSDTSTSGGKSTQGQELRCYHCDKKGHCKPQCPDKDLPWYKVPPVNNNYVRKHHTKDGPKPIKYCTTCKTWRFDDKGGHLAKDHAKWEERRPQSDCSSTVRFQDQGTPTADVAAVDDESIASDASSESESDTEVIAGNFAGVSARWI